MRKHWIDNLRWVTVLLVLLYHVIYFYNSKGVVGGIGGFGEGPQYQDIVMVHSAANARPATPCMQRKRDVRPDVAARPLSSGKRWSRWT